MNQILLSLKGTFSAVVCLLYVVLSLSASLLHTYKSTRSLLFLYKITKNLKKAIFVFTGPYYEITFKFYTSRTLTILVAVL